MNATFKAELDLLRVAHQVEMRVFMDNFLANFCACKITHGKQFYGCTNFAHIRISNEQLLNQINANYRKVVSDAEIRLGDA